MKKEVISKLGHNLLMELKRKDYTKDERQDIIDCFMKETGMSLRDISKEYGIPHTTIFGWLNPEKKEQHLANYAVGSFLTQLNQIDRQISIYIEKIDACKLKINDDCRKKIGEIKDRWNYIYMKTRKVIVD